eukprot:5079629-Prymnesium_polylepis.1
MIGCDMCGCWYHGPCVGVGKAVADAMDEYQCPTCCRLQQKEYAFGVPPRPKLTRRPFLRFVTTLLQEVEELGIEIPEVLPIAEICEKAQEWEACAYAHLLEIEQVCLSSSTSALSATMALVHDGDTLEVKPELLGVLQRRVQLHEEWSDAVEELHDHPQDQKRGVAIATGAWEKLDNALALEVQATLLHITVDKTTSLISSLESGPQWQVAACATLATRTGMQFPADQLLSSRPMHISPDIEQLKLAAARQAILPAFAGHDIEPADGFKEKAHPASDHK